jgi:hypothetical protein
LSIIDGSVTDVLAGDGNTPSGYPAQLPSSDLELALEELADSDGAYQTAEQYYKGTRAEANASIRLRRAMARTGQSFRMNFAKKPVEAVTERLEIAAVTSPTSGAQAKIDDLWRDNKLGRQSKTIMRNAGKFGDAYVIVWPSPDDDPDADGIGSVDIFYNSPRSCRVFYDPENPMRKAFAVKQWILTAQKRVRVDLYYPDRIEKYWSKAGITHPKAADMIPFYDTDLPGADPADVDEGPGWPRVNPFGQIPVFHFRNDDPYGCPEHEGFYGVQDAIRKLVLSHMAGVDYNAFPQRYALSDGTDSSEFAAGDEDEFQFALDTGATSRPGDPQSQLSADAGSVWWLNGVKGVGQFEQAQPTVFTDPLTLYLRFGGLITDTPLTRLDPTGAPLSGEAVRAMEAPFTKKIKDRQEYYGETWAELFAFALLILGVDDADVDVHWKSPATVDDQTGWQTLMVKLEAGLPVRQAFLEAGYTSDQIDEWFGDGDDDLPVQVDMLLKIGQALQALGAALGFGILQEEQVQVLISQVVGEAVNAARIDEPDDPPAPELPAATVDDDKPLIVFPAPPAAPQPGVPGAVPAAPATG